jgi:hypothetical protein
MKAGKAGTRDGQFSACADPAECQVESMKSADGRQECAQRLRFGSTRNSIQSDWFVIRGRGDVETPVRALFKPDPYSTDNVL